MDIHWIFVLVAVQLLTGKCAISFNRTRDLRDKALEMFDHAYSSYMTHAFPADELMPLSCEGRFRGNKPSRGDVDESLGNFTLTLVDTLDTLALLGRLDDFETAIRLVLQHTWFDTDVVVSVFETNIRMLGGLLGGHVAAIDLKAKGKCCDWYTDELLKKALDIGERLLPAFNTTSGIPYPKVNLRYGIKRLKFKDTCTACAGTMVLEFAALSRLTGDKRFEEAAHKAMDFLWEQRNVHSNLMGTVLNVQSGDWIRRESGIGAGIDSYYEYLLKAYILLGDDVYLTRFNKHYDAIMMYINQGPLMLNVDMHKPTVSGRNIMDALLAFWPGLQVLKGDLKSAIEMHEVLYQITQRHNFLPEAVTADFHVHWGQHPLRPEFVESTYFLYKATGDPHYIDVGRTVLENLEKHARVPCGFAAIKDVRGNTHENQMDSFVLAETFKYLYLLFEEEENIVLDVSQYVFTTEAHILPLSLANHSLDTKKMASMKNVKGKSAAYHDHSCPNIRELSQMSVVRYAETIRSPLKNFVELKCPKPKPTRVPRLRAASFITGDTSHAKILNSMGVDLQQTSDGRLQLSHSPNKADNEDLAEEGLAFMKEMLELAQNHQDTIAETRVIQMKFSDPSKKMVTIQAGPAQFGWDFVPGSDPILRVKSYKEGYMAPIVRAEPFNACTALENGAQVAGNMVLVFRGSCTFIDKARVCQRAGAVGVIVMDNVEGSSKAKGGFFQMSGDEVNDVSIPVVFLFTTEARLLTYSMEADPGLEVYVAKTSLKESGKDSAPVKYPRQFITLAYPQMTMYVEEENFIITATIQSALPENRDEILNDAIEFDVMNEKMMISLTPIRFMPFNVERNEMPAKGLFYEAFTDLIMKYLDECGLVSNSDTLLHHVSSLVGYLYQTFAEDVDKPTRTDTELTLFLIETLKDCRPATQAEEASDKPKPEAVKKVSDLDTPHVGEFPEFYSRPAEEEAYKDIAANEQADTAGLSSEKKYQRSVPSEEGYAEAKLNEQANHESSKSTSGEASKPANGEASIPTNEKAHLVSDPPADAAKQALPRSAWKPRQTPSRILASGRDRPVRYTPPHSDYGSKRSKTLARQQRAFIVKYRVVRYLATHPLLTNENEIDDTSSLKQKNPIAEDIQKSPITDSLNESETEKHIQSIAPENERAGAYSDVSKAAGDSQVDRSQHSDYEDDKLSEEEENLSDLGRDEL